MVPAFPEENPANSTVEEKINMTNRRNWFLL